MLYLEDYLEMIEHLPQELRDRFTEMRELDLSVQNDNDSIDKQIKIFFSQCRRGEIISNQADQTFESIRKDYCKVVEDSDEKVQLANQMYDLVERYLKKLDTELLKFKCELEADHHGITDVLEKRSLELDGSSSIPSQKENRYFGSISQNQNRSLSERYRVKPEKRRDSSSTISTPTEKRHTLTASLSTPTARPSTPNIPHQVLQTTPTVSYTGNATIIAAAAAQAIEKTQQMQQGRRTASLKASYEAIHGSGGSSIPHELLIGRDLTGTHALQSMERDVSFAVTTAAAVASSSSSSATTPGSSNQKRHKKKMTTSSMSLPPSHPPQSSSSNASSNANANALLHQLQQTHSNDSDEMPSVYINDSGMVVEQTQDGEWVYDPNEPRYCICNQVSYGEMVACDNEDCPLEWFHYPCVGITSSPKGKWYCPDCTRARGLKKTKKL